MPVIRPMLLLVILVSLLSGAPALSRAAMPVDDESLEDEAECDPPQRPSQDSRASVAVAPPSLVSELPGMEYPCLRLAVEIGFLGVADHLIQFGKNGTEFRYQRDGGQDLLFATTRFSVEAAVNEISTFILLYQPLELETRDTLRHDLRVDNTLFPAGTAMRFFYGFPFYRASYLYDFDPDSEQELALGFSLQVRNADIVFSSLDGTLLARKADVGPVPLLKFRWRQPWAGKWWLGAEADGIYAPVSYLNGSDEEITGALLDASLRLGLDLENDQEAFINLRYLGGGAVGTNRGDQAVSDGYVKNWLHFFTVSVGLALKLF
ncbi:MAG: hypothetical protein AB1439_01190 [candidate division FCPU426 bacterium]